jgi:hypothetical protein
MYQVEWTRSARAELATAWIEADATQREAITAATVQIDQALQSSPGEFGESRTGNRRIAFVPPLGLAFSVDEAHQRAKVLHVWLI